MKVLRSDISSGSVGEEILPLVGVRKQIYLISGETLILRASI